MALDNDLTLATRSLFDRTMVDQVFLRMPFLEELQRRSQITFKGGKFVEKLIDTDEIDDLVQMYSTNEALRDEKKTTLAKPAFFWKKGQIPLRYDADEELMNKLAGNEEQLLDVVEHLVTKGQRATKLNLMKQVFNTGSTTPIADGDGIANFQSLVSGLDHDSTYGGLSRSFSGGTNDFWQSSDPSGLVENITSSTQDTAVNLNLSNMRKWVNETNISHNMEGTDDILFLMCPTLWDQIAAEMEAKTVGKAGKKQDQGIRSMIWDGHEIMSVPFLQTSTTMRKWVFVLNLRYWELQIHSSRNYKMTPFKWQGEMSGGHDYWLARILFKANLVCWKPNSSMWLSNVT